MSAKQRVREYLEADGLSFLCERGDAKAVETRSVLELIRMSELTFTPREVSTCLDSERELVDTAMRLVAELIALSLTWTSLLEMRSLRTIWVPQIRSLFALKALKTEITPFLTRAFEGEEKAGDRVDDESSMETSLPGEAETGGERS